MPGLMIPYLVADEEEAFILLFLFVPSPVAAYPFEM